MAVEPDPFNLKLLMENVARFSGLVTIVPRTIWIKDDEQLTLDIEGAELHVLTDPTLDTSKIKNIVLEVHYRYGCEEARKIIEPLKRQGFKIYPLFPTRGFSWFLLTCKDALPW